MAEQIEVLKDFRYGSISDPQRMTKGNIQNVPDGVSDRTLAKWIEMRWVRMVK
jgi:hypothetical protein